MKLLFYFDESSDTAFMDAFRAASDGALADVPYRYIAAFKPETSLSTIFGLAGNHPAHCDLWHERYGARSMSVGDAVLDTDTGTVHLCRPVGWCEVPDDGRLVRPPSTQEAAVEI